MHPWHKACAIREQSCFIPHVVKLLIRVQVKRFCWTLRRKQIFSVLWSLFFWSVEIKMVEISAAWIQGGGFKGLFKGCGGHWGTINDYICSGGSKPSPWGMLPLVAAHLTSPHLTCPVGCAEESCRDISGILQLEEKERRMFLNLQLPECQTSYLRVESLHTISNFFVFALGSYGTDKQSCM